MGSMDIHSVTRVSTEMSRDSIDNNKTTYETLKYFIEYNDIHGNTHTFELNLFGNPGDHEPQIDTPEKDMMYELIFLRLENDALREKMDKLKEYLGK